MNTLTATARRWAVPLRWATGAGFVLSLATHQARLVHAIIGCVFTVAGIGHILANARWIRTVSGRIGRGLPRKVTTDAIIDATMAVLVAAIAGTGIVSMAIDSSSNPEGDSTGIGDFHGSAAFVLFALVVTHVARHRNRRGGRSKRSREVSQRSAVRL